MTKKESIEKTDIIIKDFINYDNDEIATEGFDIIGYAKRNSLIDILYYKKGIAYTKTFFEKEKDMKKIDHMTDE